MTEFINGVYQLPKTPTVDSYAELYARQQEKFKRLERDLELKNQQIRHLTYQNITLKNQIHGLYSGEITLTQALSNIEQYPDIEIS